MILNMNGKMPSTGGLQLHEPIRVLHVVNKMNQGGVQSLIMTFYRNIDRSKIQFDFVGDSFVVRPLGRVC